MTAKAVINIDVVSNETGEVLKSFNNVWIGEFKNILSQYVVVEVERAGDNRVVWVQE